MMTYIKNKYVKRNIAVELESSGTSLDKCVDRSLKENFHEYLQSSTNVLAKNIYDDKDNAFKSLTGLKENKDIVVLAIEKESYAVILNKYDYIEKVDDIIEDEIIHRKNVETTDNTYNELKRFQDLLYCHFYKHEHYKEMRPRANQPFNILQMLRRINLNLSVKLL